MCENDSKILVINCEEKKANIFNQLVYTLQCVYSFTFKFHICYLHKHS